MIYSTIPITLYCVDILLITGHLRLNSYGRSIIDLHCRAMHCKIIFIAVLYLQLSLLANGVLLHLPH